MISTFFSRYRTLISLTFIIFLALLFRLYKINTIPLGLNNDGAWEGLAARDILRGNWQDYIPYAADSWRGEPIVRMLIVALSPWFGVTALTIKLATVILGTSLIVPLYLYIKRVFSERLAFFTTFFIATSGWNIVMSKSGWRAISVPLAATLFFVSAQWAVGSKKVLRWIMVGICLGLSLYTYDAGRIIPLFALGLFIATMVTQPKFFARNKQGILTACISSIIIAAPMLIFAITHPQTYIGRSAYVFVHSPQLLWDNIVTTVLLFTHRGNGNDFFINSPLLDAPSIWLFPIGLAIAIWYALRAKQRRFQLMLTWFFVSLIPGILSSPNGNRVIGAIPTVYFFIALAVASIADFFAELTKSHRTVIYFMIVAYFCIFSGIVSYLTYLSSDHIEVPGFYPETLRISQAIIPMESNTDVYITDNYPRELLTFYITKTGNPFIKQYTWFDKRDDMLGVIPKPGRNTVFFLMDTPDDAALVQKLMIKFPSSLQKSYSFTDGNVHFSAGQSVIMPME